VFLLEVGVDTSRSTETAAGFGGGGAIHSIEGTRPRAAKFLTVSRIMRREAMASCGVLPDSSASDELLARGVREGDDRAFELLYERYWRSLRRYAGRLLHDAAAGEDVAQIALANAHRALRAGQTPQSVRPWLYTIARNAAWGLRTERAEHVELTPALEARVEPPAPDTAALTTAVAQLPERQRSVFALRELRGASNRETAEILGLRESQVEQLLFAGRARLAELLLFGDSVSCEDVRAAATAGLSRHQRRAFKRHAHHCADCRAFLGGRLRLGARLLAPAEALRRLLELVAGASVPAKAGTAAAIAIAASSPFVLPAAHSLEDPIRRGAPTEVVATAQPDEPTSTPARAAAPRTPIGNAGRRSVRLPARVAGTTPAQLRPQQPAARPAAQQPVPPQPVAAAEPPVVVSTAPQPEPPPTAAAPTREQTTTTRTIAPQPTRQQPPERSQATTAPRPASTPQRESRATETTESTVLSEPTEPTVPRDISEPTTPPTEPAPDPLAQPELDPSRPAR
jgi:RNA polymerase sigma factor (sigma-70 family)